MRYKSPHVVSNDIKIQGGHRMSDTQDTTDVTTSDDTTQTGSLFDNLKNKVAYNLHKATYDPDANKFAAAQKQAADEAKQQDNTTADSTDTTDQGDPNKFSAKRLAKKVGNQTLDILKKIFIPFLALMLSMIVANEMIVYSAPIRIIFFIFTFLICYFANTLGIILAIFYLLKGGYSYYVNNMTNRPKRNIMPQIFALLPISTYKPMSSFGAFFLYPFTYPKTEKGAIQLPEIMKGYLEDLKKSFTSLDDVKNLPVFVQRLKTIQEELTHLHDTVSNPEEANDVPKKNVAPAPTIAELPANKNPFKESSVATPAQTQEVNPFKAQATAQSQEANPFK